MSRLLGVSQIAPSLLEVEDGSVTRLVIHKLIDELGRLFLREHRDDTDGLRWRLPDHTQQPEPA